MDDEKIDSLVRRTTLRQVEVILAIHENQSMTKAAAALGMSVANVSLVAKRFENNLGVRLFEGQGRRFELNAQSEEIMSILKPLQGSIDSLRASLKSLNGDWS
jgi:DNA-binding transcriptional LysR family regulator